MKRSIVIVALVLAGCASKELPLPETQVFAEGAFRRDEVYGARHIASLAPCPGLIDGIARVRASINLDGPRYDWCQYTDRKSANAYDIRIERKPGETPAAGLLALKGSDLDDPQSWTETAADFPDRQAVGFTWSKPGSVSHGIWVAKNGDWRIALFADYPEAKRAQVIAAANDYFRKLRTR